MKNAENPSPKRSFEFDIEWKSAFDHEGFKHAFANEILEQYIPKKRWYAGKSSHLKYIEITDFVRLKSEKNNYFAVLIEVNFQEAFFQNYFIPVAFMSEAELDTNTLIAPAQFNGVSGYLVDALHIEDFRKLLFERIAASAELREFPNIIFHKSALLGSMNYESSRFMGAEQSNTSIVYNETYVLKIFRRIYISTNPDYEINRFLTEVCRFENTPEYVGSVNLSIGEEDNITIGLMQRLIPNQGDAWNYFLKEMDEVFTNLERKKIKLADIPDTEHYKRIRLQNIPHQIIDWAGLNLFQKVQQLALRTAQMHVALGSDTRNTSFVPTNFNGDYEVWLKNRLTYQFQNRLNTIENNLHKLEGESMELAKVFLNRKNEIRRRFLDFDWTKLKSERIRIHGDYHLGQVLVDHDDFYLLDFEGEPESTIRDRKVKQPPIKDIAGMFRSFHYAIYSVILNNGSKFPYEREELFVAGEKLYHYICGSFLYTYVDHVQKNNLNIGYTKEIEFLLQYCLLEKAVYELGYELNSRPRWALIPLRGILQILNK